MATLKKKDVMNANEVIAQVAEERNAAPKMSDLQDEYDLIAGYEKLSAKVPLKEMASYSTALSSLTGGRASFIMKFASYELVPSDVQDKLVKE